METDEQITEYRIEDDDRGARTAVAQTRNNMEMMNTRTSSKSSRPAPKSHPTEY
jgi:hypothetical protein